MDFAAATVDTAAATAATVDTVVMPATVMAVTATTATVMAATATTVMEDIIARITPIIGPTTTVTTTIPTPITVDTVMEGDTVAITGAMVATVVAMVATVAAMVATVGLWWLRWLRCYYPYYSGYNYPPAPVVPSVTANAAPYNGAPNQQSAQPFMPPADSKNGQTYPYDGGPASPLPKAGDTDPAKEPIPQPNTARRSYRHRALPSPYTFSAYGGQPANQGKVITVVVGKPAPLPSPYAATTAKVQRPATMTATATKIAYPAYGEQPLRPAVRVQLTQNR